MKTLKQLLKRLKSSSPYAVLSLVAANGIPAWYAASSGLRPADLIFLYWLETWIIAFYISLKIKRAEVPMTEAEKNLMRVQFLASGGAEPTRESIRRTFVKQFFLVIIFYGVFLFGVLVPNVFGGEGNYVARVVTALPADAATWFWIFASALGFIVSHGISYSSNFLAKQEYLNTSPARQSLMLGDRLIAMHVFLMLGSVFSGAFAEYKAGAVLGIALIKFVADLASHSKEHIIARAIGLGNSVPAWRGSGTIKFFIGGSKKS